MLKECKERCESPCRGRLQPEFGGGEIAVKVQRPGVLLSVSLDLFLMRWIAMFLDGWVCFCAATLPLIMYTILSIA